MTETIWLQRPSADVPWGFRLQGGWDKQQPLSVQKVSAGSIAATGLNEGDLILMIGEAETSSLTFSQAQNLVKSSGNLLQFTIAKGSKDPSSGYQYSQNPASLDNQMAGMNIGGGYGGYNRPQQSYGGPPGAPDYNYSNAYNQSPSSQGYGSQRPQAGNPPPMPDAVLNMAARGAPDKKPWAYAPDLNVIKEQRDRVRRRPPGAALPRYQNLLNMPNFDESPAPGVPQTPPQTYGQPAYGSGQGGQAIVHAQYNSPLDMYSEENVADSLAGQTGLVVSPGVGGPQKGDITASPTWKMIHGVDAPKQRQRVVPAEAYSRPVRQPSADDELSFTGINRPTDIPSKSFHRLQQNIGGSEIDTSSIRPAMAGDVDEVSGYDEASIRYRGKNIPSKSFRMLQSMTGGANLSVPEPRRTRKVQPAHQVEADAPHPDDIVDISYVGGNIPSKSFRYLQKSIGEPATQPDPGYNDNDQPEPQGRTVKVIQLRTAQKNPEKADVTDF